MYCPHCHQKMPVADIADVDFHEFWLLYPLKKAKKAAEKAWRKAATSEAVRGDIMDALYIQIHTKQWRDKHFIPHASTWLNGRRWEDEQQERVGVSPRRMIACDLCGDTGIACAFPEADTMVVAWCSCARGALPGLMTGIYRVSTGERLGDVPGLVIPQGEETPF